MAEFDSLVAIVTGGASGIGAAVARRLADGGATVAVFDLKPGGADRHFAVDVSDDASVVSAVAAVVETFGRIDIVVNNAGVGAQGDLTANDDSEWHRVWDINVVGMARVTRAALPHLRVSPSAAVVNVASIVATAGVPQRVLYSATKGAVLSMTRAMALTTCGKASASTQSTPEPLTPPGSMPCWPPPSIPRLNVRPSKRVSPTGDLLLPRRSPTLLPTWRAHAPVRRPEHPLPSTGECRNCACGRHDVILYDPLAPQAIRRSTS